MSVARLPAIYGPSTTIYNRWNRWSRRMFWQRLFEALRALPPDDDFHAIDSTTAKAHRSAGRVETYGPPRRQAVFWRWHEQSSQTYPAFRLCR
jgi:transposase